MSDSDASFQDILKTNVDQIKPPSPLPPGEYLAVVDGQAEFTKVGQKQTPAIDFNLKPMMAKESVNTDALSAALDGKSLQDKRIRHRLFVTPDSAWRVKQFLTTHLGLEGGRPLEQLIPEAMGRQVVVTIGHRSSDDGTQVFQEVKATAHV